MSEAGEVAVRTGSDVTALEAPELDGKRLEVDLGGDRPVARIPQEVGVEYRNEPAADGGALEVRGTRAQLRGFSLDDSDVTAMLWGAALLLASAGYAWGASDVVLAIILGCAGVLTGYLGVQARAGGAA